MNTIDRRIFLTLAGGAAAAALLPLAGCGGGDPYPPVSNAGEGPMSATAEGRQFQALGKSHTLVIKDRDGRELRCGGVGFGAGKLNFPAGVAVLDGLAYVVETGNHRVQVFDETGSARSIIGEGQLLYPSGIAAGKSEIFVADTWHGRIVAFSADGRVTRVLGTGMLSAPRGIAVLDDGLLVADAGLRKVLKLGFDGVTQLELGGDWILPYDVATDGTLVYVADVARNELGVVALTGERLDGLQLASAPANVWFRKGTLYVVPFA